MAADSQQRCRDRSIEGAHRAAHEAAGSSRSPRIEGRGYPAPAQKWWRQCVWLRHGEHQYKGLNVVIGVLLDYVHLTLCLGSSTDPSIAFTHCNHMVQTLVSYCPHKNSARISSQQ